MSKAYWKDVSITAAEMVEENEAAEKANPAISTRNLPYPYKRKEDGKGLDCKDFVEECVRRAGGAMKYSGSNRMFREACTMIMPLEKARESGLLHSGCLLFIVEQDGDYLDEYKADGLGNASHVGLYIDMKNKETGNYIEVAHSSSSRDKVAASTLKNAWTHVGWAKCIQYEDDVQAVVENGLGAVANDQAVEQAREAVSTPVPVTLPPHSAIVVSDTLRARKALSTRGSSTVVMEMKKGRVLTDIQTGFWYDSGEPAVSGMIAGTRHPRVYAAVRSLTTGEEFLRVNETDEAVEINI